jgi:hypothetical protein
MITLQTIKATLLIIAALSAALALFNRPPNETPQKFNWLFIIGISIFFLSLIIYIVFSIIA